MAGMGFIGQIPCQEPRFPGGFYKRLTKEQLAEQSRMASELESQRLGAPKLTWYEWQEWELDTLVYGEPGYWEELVVTTKNPDKTFYVRYVLYPAGEIPAKPFAEAKLVKVPQGGRFVISDPSQTPSTVAECWGADCVVAFFRNYQSSIQMMQRNLQSLLMGTWSVSW